MNRILLLISGFMGLRTLTGKDRKKCRGVGLPDQYAVYRSAAVLGTSRRHRFCGAAVAVGGRRDTIRFSGQRNVEKKQTKTLTLSVTDLQKSALNFTADK